MSIKWLYITIVVIMASWLRYKGYKRSVRLEKKLDMALDALGVDVEKELPEKSKKLATKTERRKIFRLIKNSSRGKKEPEAAGSGKK